MSVGDTFEGNIESSGDRDWVAIHLTAGETYDINVLGSPSGTGTLSDPVMAVYDAAGAYLDGNDDGGNSTESFLAFTATSTGTYYVMARGYSAATGTYEISVDIAAPEPPRPDPVTADLDTLALYLTNGYWQDGGSSPHKFDTSTSNVITVNLEGLTEEGRQLARWAMEAWESVADIAFSETSSRAMITFDDASSGAFASYSWSGGYTTSASVNVSTNWLANSGTELNSYSFQTYLHEIGHALGLGHMGDYNGSAVYGTDNKFINDSWQVSVMSYFSQTENTTVAASYEEVVTAMSADIVAIQNLYGAAGTGSLTGGATTYGVGHTLGNSWLGQVFDGMAGTAAPGVFDSSSVAMTLFDVGGYDVLDLSNDTINQDVRLTQGGVSSVDGETGNLLIARGTIIEEFRAGTGNDTVRGNEANNVLDGNAGNDTLRGLRGKDSLFGGDGADQLLGGNGADDLSGGTGTDLLNGGNGQDRANYSASHAAVGVDLELSVQSSGGTAQGDTLISIENLLGSAHSDSLSGNSETNLIRGGRGDDAVDGRAGNDKLYGATGKDNLDGGTGNDQLFGGRWSDTLSGGAGNDRLSGGMGRDTFVYDGGHDTIVDFANDKLNIDDVLWGQAIWTKSQVLATATVAGADTVFDFGGGNTLTLEGYSDLDALGSDLTIV